MAAPSATSQLAVRIAVQGAADAVDAFRKAKKAFEEVEEAHKLGKKTYEDYRKELMEVIKVKRDMIREFNIAYSEALNFSQGIRAIGNIFSTVQRNIVAWNTEIIKKQGYESSAREATLRLEEAERKYNDAVKAYGQFAPETIKAYEELTKRKKEAEQATGKLTEAEKQSAALMATTVVTTITSVVNNVINLKKAMLDANGVIDFFSKGIHRFVELLGTMGLAVTGVAVAAVALYAAYQTNFLGLRDLIDGVVRHFQRRTEEWKMAFEIHKRGVAAVLEEETAKVREEGLKQMMEIERTYQSRLSMIDNALKQELDEVKRHYADLFDEDKTYGQKLIDEAKERYQRLIDEVNRRYDKLIDDVNSKYDKMLRDAEAFYDEQIRLARAPLEELREERKKDLRDLEEWFLTEKQKLKERFGDDIEATEAGRRALEELEREYRKKREKINDDYRLREIQAEKQFEQDEEQINKERAEKIKEIEAQRAEELKTLAQKRVDELLEIERTYLPRLEAFQREVLEKERGWYDDRIALAKEKEKQLADVRARIEEGVEEVRQRVEDIARRAEDILGRRAMMAPTGGLAVSGLLTTVPEEVRGMILGGRQHGGRIDVTGKYLLHRKEWVLSEGEVRDLGQLLMDIRREGILSGGRGAGKTININSPLITVSGYMDERLARDVMDKILWELRRLVE